MLSSTITNLLLKQLDAVFTNVSEALQPSATHFPSSLRLRGLIFREIQLGALSCSSLLGGHIGELILNLDIPCNPLGAHPASLTVEVHDIELRLQVACRREGWTFSSSVERESVLKKVVLYNQFAS
jgi:hypothetical protein